MLGSNLTDIVATTLFALAIVHTFSVKWFQQIAHRFPDGSPGENFFHLLGEIEVVFGIWSAAFLGFLAVHIGKEGAIEFLEGQNFTEPLFVFVIMTIASTQPVLFAASQLISVFSKLIPAKRSLAFYWSTLVLGPLLGSFITEPAAMTVTALVLLNRFYLHPMSESFKYATIGLLFVNISIGGTLTPFAAPPVLMVAAKWDWDFMHMMTHFGFNAIAVILIMTTWITFRYRKEISAVPGFQGKIPAPTKVPHWVVGLHLLSLLFVVYFAHHQVVFLGFFLFFLGLVTVTREYQTELKLREGLLVAFFLAGLVILGGPQRWWLEPLLAKLEILPLYLGAIGLTAITDNAALTYLGAQVPNLSDAAKHALVAGAVAGGGLTVIANAPNPAGFGILNSSFGKDGISPLRLFLGALPPTLVAALWFWVY